MTIKVLAFVALILLAVLSENYLLPAFGALLLFLEYREYKGKRSEKIINNKH